MVLSKELPQQGWSRQGKGAKVAREEKQAGRGEARTEADPRTLATDVGKRCVHPKEKWQQAAGSFSLPPPTAQPLQQFFP